MISSKDYMWSVAANLIREQDFSLFHIEDQLGINDHFPTLHFLKNVGRRYLYLRLISIDFIWPNHLQQEMEQAVIKADQISRQVSANRMDFFNIYLFQAIPSYEIQQMIAQSSKTLGNHLDLFFGYVDLENQQLGIPEGTFEYLKITKEPFVDSFSNPISIEPEQLIEEMKEIQKRKEEEYKQVFQFGKPILTYFLIAINAVFFFLMTLKGGSTNTEVLLDFGAKESFLITQGEYWRLFTPIFLHIGFLHFALNNVALHYLGQMTERIYGSTRFLLIYLFAGIIGNISSFLFAPNNIGAGASGAIFGLFGALLYFGYVNPDLFFRTMGKDIISVIMVNLVFGMVVPNIDNYAHLGGLIGGFLIAAIVHLPNQKHNKWLVTLIATMILLIVSVSTWWGINGREVKGSEALLLKGEKALQNNNLNEAHTLFNQLVKSYPDNPYAHYYFASTLLKEGQLEQAAAYYQKSLELQPKLYQAHYYLALISIFEKNEQKAIQHLQKALEINPDFNEAKQLLKEIQ
ncbi:MAG: rhomboid family intramembrane serine protease [Tepidibacillus sp.]